MSFIASILDGDPVSDFSSRRRWAALTVLSASLLVITMDMTILNIALPEMVAELNPTANQQLWIIDVYSLVLAGLLVSTAALGDRWGRKRVLLLGYLIFAGSSLAIFMANSAESVIAVRILLGIGGAMIMPTTLSLIRVIFTNAGERATALSIWAAVSGIGAAVGPLVGGVLLEYFSWHAAFLVNVPLMIVAIIAGLVLLPESRVAHPGPWDALAAALSLVGMTLLVWAIKAFGEEANLVVPRAWLATVLALVALGWFAIRSLRSDFPLLDLRLFRSRLFSVGIIAAFGSTFGMMAALFLIVQWLQLVDGASPIEAGIRLIPVTIGAAVTAIVAPPLARKIGARAVLAGGLTLAGIGMVLIGIQRGTLELSTVLIGLALVGAGAGSLAIGSALIMMGSREEKAGNAGALEETAYEVGSVLGVAVLGSIAATIFRSELEDQPAFQNLGAAVAKQAEQSLGAAMEIAFQFDLPGLAHAAGGAFTQSMQLAGLIGGVIMFIVAALVFVLTPKGTDISQTSH